MKKLVEKPKEAPGEVENEDDVNGNVEVIGNDDDEWQVSCLKHPNCCLKKLFTNFEKFNFLN